ncbi:MAG: transglutaminase-like domain-containing protein [Elusimicrobia bacterium]|nr:transglutaminase-like domain-containing protein [Elusimicrobiota bacterium]
MKENERIKALINLIAGETQENADRLKTELAGVIRESPAAFKDMLEKEFKDDTPLFVHTLLEEMAFDKLKDGFAVFASKINPDLEEGLELVSRFHNPFLQTETLRRHMDILTEKLRPFMLNCADILDIAQVFQVIFFKTLKFEAVTIKLKPEHLSFEVFLDTREGTGLMNAALYVMSAQRFNLDVNIVDFSGRLMVSFEDENYSEPFYADPFDGGKVLTLRECMDYTAARGLTWDNGCLTPLTTRQIIKRALANMVFVYKKINDEQKLRFLREYISMFE